MGNAQNRCYWKKRGDNVMKNVNEGLKREKIHLKQLNTIPKKRK